jgi:hypothetical protein
MQMQMRLQIEADGKVWTEKHKTDGDGRTGDGWAGKARRAQAPTRDEGEGRMNE